MAHINSVRPSPLLGAGALEPASSSVGVVGRPPAARTDCNVLSAGRLAACNTLACLHCRSGYCSWRSASTRCARKSSYCSWYSLRMSALVLSTSQRSISFALYYTIQYYTILCYTILYYTILYYTILYYTCLLYTSDAADE